MGTATFASSGIPLLAVLPVFSILPLAITFIKKDG
jgi:hypothetical protein